MAQAEILAIETPAQFERAVERACALLKKGEVVALPTETVYGLAANALDRAAVLRLFAIKGRPPQNPIIVHVASLDMARACVASWPAAAQLLADSFWPGPLTLVLRKANRIPAEVTAGAPTVGVRWPSHPFMQAVIRATGFPLAVPSANRSGELSPTTAQHVAKQLGEAIPLIVDGGPAQVGIESTVVQLTTDPPLLLRPGIIDAPMLAAVVGPLEETSVAASRAGAALPSPGLLEKHYAPQARLYLLEWRDEADLDQQLSNLPHAPNEIHILAHHHIPFKKSPGTVHIIPHEPEAFARALYAALHHCDDAGAGAIIVEKVPDTGPWHAIADRLRRAAY